MACCVYDAVSVKWFAVASLLHLNPWIQDPDCTEDSTHSAALACEWARLHFLLASPVDMQLATCSTVAILPSNDIITAAKGATQQKVLPPAGSALRL
ncbi:unnamed protein product [Cladocopium goreaui]|uniref:Uncharacterized protein n=1 Tax=Cladocopium goreaui TaxID=2562237 RepID=A0A9P1M3Z5_9DINO|nr:unnamed protein product [Cladocopium goreaui]